MDYQYSTLANGIRIIHKHVPNHVAHCGVVINAGSRDESEAENGIAHFIEHLIFKGTKRRKAFHILSRLENVGGELNAYTAKEETFLYASFLHQHYDRALELFSDILFNSVFPEKEIKKEKDVVLDEINSYKDSPSELIFDEFEELIFNDHPIGRCILGSPESVKSFSRKDVLDFMQRTYLTESMVITSVGNISFDKLVQQAGKHFGHIPQVRKPDQRIGFANYIPVNKSEAKSNFQVHSILGTPAYDLQNEKKTTLALLTNILGGPGMNSRLNLSVREKYGYCYNVEAHFQPYSDTGYFNIYLGCDNGFLEKSLRIIYKELKMLRENRLGTLQLHRAKQQIAGQFAISLESNLNEMISIGKSHLFFKEVESFKEINEKIEKYTASDLLAVANEIFVQDQFSMLTFVPRENGTT